MYYHFKTDDADIDAIVDLINRAYRDTNGVHRWTTEHHLIAGDRITVAGLRQTICDASTDFILGYENDKLVGCIAIKYVNDIAEFGTFAIEPDYQGMGYGNMLFAFAEQHALQNCQTFQVTVVSQNLSLINFYRKRGYTELAGKLPFPVNQNVGQPIDENLDLTVLQKASPSI